MAMKRGGVTLPFGERGVSTFPVVGLAHTFKVCVFGRPGTLADLKVCASRRLDENV